MEFDNSVIKIWTDTIFNKGIISEEGINEKALIAAEDFIYPASVNKVNGDVIALLKWENSRPLVVMGPNICRFQGKQVDAGKTRVHFCPLTHANAEILRKHLPFTAPSVLSESGIGITIGLGDRLGMANPGHIQIIRKYNAAPVLAQQSLRELDLTNRTYHDAIDAATWSVFQEGYAYPWGADGDHLKTEEWVEKAVKLGCTMITADLSDHIHKEYSIMDVHFLMEKYKKLDSDYRSRVEEKYLKLEIKLDTGDMIRFSPEELARVVLIYKDAVDHALRLYKAGTKTKRKFDFELSVDETETPTLPQAHIFVAMEAKDKGICFTSLAPRFVGEFQKGIDYIGDVNEFQGTFKVHAAIARYFSYRISVHSGSDKFSVFPSVGEMTGGVFHLKTSGTSWLQALKVIAEREPVFYRKLHKFALEVYPTARKYYHVTPNLDNLTDIDSLADDRLPGIFDNPDDRRVLHISYGEILKDKQLKEDFFSILDKNIENYWTSLEEHIGRHMELLGVKLREESSN